MKEFQNIAEGIYIFFLGAGFFLIVNILYGYSKQLKKIWCELLKQLEDRQNDNDSRVIIKRKGEG